MDILKNNCWKSLGYQENPLIEWQCLTFWINKTAFANAQKCFGINRRMKLLSVALVAILSSTAYVSAQVWSQIALQMFWDQGEKLKFLGWLYHLNCSSWSFPKFRSAFAFGTFCRIKKTPPFLQMFLAICKCKLDHTWRPPEVCLLPVPLRREHELRGCRLWCCHLPLHFWLQPPPRRKHHRRMPRQNTGRTGSLKTKATSPETACAVRKYRFWRLLYQRQHKVPSNTQEPHKQNYTIRPDRTQTIIFPQI